MNPSIPTPARTWAIVSFAGSITALIGFLVPWFFARGAPGGEFTFSGGQLIVAAVTAPFQPYFTLTSFFVIILLAHLLVLTGLLIPLLASLFYLLGKPIARLTRLHVGVTWAALIALVVGVAWVELIFQALANFDVPNPNALLIPGVGIWLMFLGFVAILIGESQLRRAERPVIAALQS